MKSRQLRFSAIYNQFVPNVTFLYPLNTSENLTVFCFPGVKKFNIR